jgi:uncharacterized repeat protein (TIGR01451 family)
MDGNIAGCWPHHGILTAKFIAKFDTPTPPAQNPSYNVKKSVSQSGNNLTYTLTATNSGNVDLTNVKVHDNMTFDNANGVLKNVNLPSGVVGSYPDFTIAKLAAGQTVSITYEVDGSVKNITNKCGVNTGVIANVVSSSNDQNVGENNPNDNNTSSNVNQNDNSGCTTPTPKYNLIKTVDKSGPVKPGDTLNYTLAFYNLGNTDLTNVVIKDKLPAGVDLSGNVNTNVVNGNGITELNNLFATGMKVATVHAGGSVKITYSVKVKADVINPSNCQGGSVDLLNSSSATTDQSQTETNNSDNEVTTVVTVPNTCNPNFDIVKTVDKTTAKPGDTLTYTLKFANTGNQALTNVVIADKLPAGVSLVANSVVISDNLTHSGDLFNGQMLVNGPIATGANFTITYKVTINKDIALVCGDNILTNIVSSATGEKTTEDNTTNNIAKTNVPKECVPTTPTPCPTNPTLPKDSPNCKPCPTNPSMNYDNPNCKTVVPPTVTPPTTTPSPRPNTPYNAYNPGTIAATGPVETIAALLAVGALTFGIVAYMNSRRAIKANIRK